MPYGGPALYTTANGTVDLNDLRSEMQAIRDELERWRPFGMGADSWFKSIDDYLSQADLSQPYSPALQQAQNLFGQFRRVFADMVMGYPESLLDEFLVKTIVRKGEQFGLRAGPNGATLSTDFGEVRVMQLADDDSALWWHGTAEDVVVRDGSLEASHIGQVYQIDKLQPMGHAEEIQLSFRDGKPFALYLHYESPELDWDSDYFIQLYEFSGSSLPRGPILDFGVQSPEFSSGVNLGVLRLNLGPVVQPFSWSVGEQLLVTFQWENDSFSDIADVHVIEATPTWPEALAAAAIDIPAGSTDSRSVVYSITQADIDAGEVVLSVRAQGTRRATTVYATATITVEDSAEPPPPPPPPPS